MKKLFIIILIFVFAIFIFKFLNTDKLNNNKEDNVSTDKQSVIDMEDGDVSSLKAKEIAFNILNDLNI